ncbi:MAG: hypothetical protein GY867_03805 [bacterium]|nr:hypothetical protein [bacterium]
MAARKTRSRARRATTRKPVTRRTRQASQGGNPWTRQEIAFIRKYYRNNETAWVARQLKRTVYSVRYKACDLSIKKAAPSVWRGNTGVTKAAPKRTTRPTRKYSYSAKTSRTRRPASRRTTRKAPKRR